MIKQSGYSENVFIDVLVRFSGLLSIFFVLVLMFIPALLAKIDKANETVTSSMVHRKYRVSVSAGLVLLGIFQLIFLYYLIQKFSLEIYSLGVFIYFIGSLAPFMSAMFSTWKYPYLHKMAAVICFAFIPLAQLVVSMELKNLKLSYNFAYYLPLIFALVLAIMLIRYRKGNFWMQLWGFVTISAWVVIFTF